MDPNRKHERINVDIAVTVTTVLESADARIVDISDVGAQLVGIGLPRGAKCQIEYLDQTVFAQCMWSEIDRMGVRFPFGLGEGALRDAVTDLLVPPADAPAGSMAPPVTPASLSSLLPGMRRTQAGFGRRSA